MDRFIRHRVARLSRSVAARLEVIDVTRPDVLLKKSDRLRVGQRLWVRRPVPDEGVELPTPNLLYRGEGLLVLDKPAGWAVHPTASRYHGTITRLLKSWGERAHPAHRLDVETSGLLICGETPEDVRALEVCFRQHQVRKTYRAVVRGRPPERFEEATPLGFDPHSEIRLKMGRGELPAETHFRRLAQRGERAQVEASPISGRQHQIRVHLALSGFPIVGDKLYGEDERDFLRGLRGELGPEDLARLGHPRQALHAWRVSLPWRGAVKVFEAPWPDDLEGLWARMAGCSGEDQAAASASGASASASGASASASGASASASGASASTSGISASASETSASASGTSASASGISASDSGISTSASGTSASASGTSASASGTSASASETSASASGRD